MKATCSLLQEVEIRHHLLSIWYYICLLFCGILVEANMLFIGDRNVDIFINVTCLLYPSLLRRLLYRLCNYFERFPFIVGHFHKYA